MPYKHISLTPFTLLHEFSVAEGALLDQLPQ